MDPHTFSKTDPVAHSHIKLDPDPHLPAKLDSGPDPHNVNAYPEHCQKPIERGPKNRFKSIADTETKHFAGASADINVSAPKSYKILQKTTPFCS
jgi:hypothetical protein